MAITKILARNAGLSQAIQYALNGDKTQHRILTAHQNCDPGREYRQMMNTKSEVGKLDGRQCYHIIQSFKPGEVTPELALEIAKEFAAEYLPDYEVVIGTRLTYTVVWSGFFTDNLPSGTFSYIYWKKGRSAPKQPRQFFIALAGLLSVMTG